MTCSISPQNTNDFIVAELTDEATGLLVEDGVGTWEIRDAAYPDGNVILTGNVSYQGAGTYLCQVPASNLLIVGATLWRRVQIIAPEGTYTAQNEFIVADRTGECPQTYSTDDDMELAFGRSNLLKWADVDNNRDWDAVKRRMTWARTQAKAELDARLRDSAYQFPLDITNRCLIPTLLTRMEAYLAAVLLYESRGVTDVGPDGKAQHALMWHRQRVEQFIKQIFARQVKLDGAVLRSDAVQQTSEAPDFISFRDPSHRYPRRVEDDMITMTPRRDW
jgi:phage gp36-like protein